MAVHFPEKLTEENDLSQLGVRVEIKENTPGQLRVLVAQHGAQMCEKGTMMTSELHHFLFTLIKITFSICANVFLGDYNLNRNLWFMDFYTGISLLFVYFLESG